MRARPKKVHLSVPTEKMQYSMNLESVLGESLQHYGIKRKVPFPELAAP